MSRSEVTDLQVERLLLGELPEAEARRVQSALEASGDDRLARLEAENHEILADYPAQAMAKRIAARLDAVEPAQPPRWTWVWVPAVAVAAGLGLVLILVGSGRPDPAAAPIAQVERPDPGGTRIKGDPALSLLRRTAGGSEALAPAATAEAGDVLGVQYRSGGAAHGVILSLDGAGAVTLHHPTDPRGETALGEGVQVLPRAYRLDDAPNFERFVFVTSDAPLDVETVLAAARVVAAGSDPRRAPLTLPGDPRQTSVLVAKPER